MKRTLLTYLVITSIFASVSQAEFQVNTHTTYDQTDAAIATDANGNFIVVWSSYRQDGNSGGVFGQRFDASGQPLDGEFRVNSYTDSRQLCPGVAMNNGGNFVIVWESMNIPQEGMRAICAQSYDSSSQPLGSQIRVNDQNCACRYPVLR